MAAPVKTVDPWDEAAKDIKPGAYGSGGDGKNVSADPWDVAAAGKASAAPPTATAPSQKTWMDNLSHGFSGGLLEPPTERGEDPVTRLVKGASASLGRTSQAWHDMFTGKYGPSTAAEMVPLLGPGAVDTVRTLMTPGHRMEGVGMAGQMLAPALHDVPLPSTENLPNVNPFRVNPTVAAARVFPGNKLQRVPETISTIKAVSAPKFKPGISPEGELNVIPAANRAEQVYREAMDPWHARLEGQTLAGKPVLDATDTGVSELLPSEQDTARKPFTPTGKSLIARAQQDYGSPLSSRQWSDRLELLNRRLSGFYNKSDQAQSSVLADVPDNVIKAQRDAIADMLYRWMDPENEGAGPRSIQQKRGDIVGFINAAKKAEPNMVAQQPMSPFGQYISDPLKRLVTNVLPESFLPGGLRAARSSADGSQGVSMPNLQRAFKAVPATHGVNDIGTVPRPGPRLLAAPADQSGPLPSAARDFLSVGHEPTTGPKLLGPATSKIGVSGVIVPDIMGKPPLRGSGKQNLLAAPAPGQPPLNILPRGSGPHSIGPAGPVPLTSRESPILLPGIRKQPRNP